MAPSSFILITLLSLAMITGITEARMAPAGEYKNLQGVGKDVAVAEAIENLMHGESASFSGENTKDCHTTSSNNENKGKVFVRDFEPRPSATAYPNDDDAKLEGQYQRALKKDFDPRPNVSAYPDDSQTTFKKDFEPRPNVSSYPDTVKDFEPRPNVSVYQG